MGNWFTDTLGDALDTLDEVSQWLQRNDPLGRAVGYQQPVRPHSGGVDLLGGRVSIGGEPEAQAPPVIRSRQDANPPEWVSKSTEAFFAGYEYVYSNFISQPLSTAIMMGYRPGEILSPTEWSRTWRAANHISPGQAFQLPYAEGGAMEQLGPVSPLAGLLTASGIGPGDTSLIDQAIDSPLKLYEPPEWTEMLPGWADMSEEERQAHLAEMGMPVDPMGGNAFVAELRDRSLGFRRYSGVTDFSARWFADPLVIGGKTIKSAREATTAPRRPGGGWSQPQIDKLVQGSRMNQFTEFVWQNRDNPALLNQTDMALQSAMGPRFGAVASVLTSKADVQDFIRVGMGDVAAQVRLGERNALARQRLEGHASRLSQQELIAANYTGRHAGAMQALAQKEIDRLQKAIDADDALVKKYESVLEHADEFDRLYLSKWQYQGARNRLEAQREYLAGPAKSGARQFRRKITPAIGKAGAEPIKVESGFHTTRLWGIGDAFALPVNIIRSMKNVHPNGYMNVDNGAALAKESVAELRAYVSRIPGISVGDRHNIQNQYLRLTSEGERKAWLDDLGRTAFAKIAEKHGMDAEAGRELFEATLTKRQGLKTDMAQYSAARVPGETGGAARVDYFEAEGAFKVHPNTVSRLVNSHILDDLTAIDKLFKRHAHDWNALRQAHVRAGNVADWIVRRADDFNSIWKFSVLFRLGYIPRTVGDDLMGQVAALGAATMAMRTGWGIKNGLTNLTLRSQRGMHDATMKVRAEEIRYADEAIAEARKELDAIGPGATPDKRQARAAAQAKLAQLDYFRGLAVRSLEDLKAAPPKKAIQGNRDVTVDGVTFPGAFSGQRGEYYMKRISGSDAYDQLFKNSRQMMHTHLQRSFDNGARPIDAIDDAAQHGTAWAHAINAQIAGDAMERMLVQGVPEEQVVRWLKRTTEGRDYWKRLGLKKTPHEEVVAKAKFEVDEYLPTPEIRAQALTPEGVTPEFLKEAIPNPAHRPTVHMGNVGQAHWTSVRQIDKTMQFFYEWGVNIPANRLSRHPLFNQLYEGHLRTIVEQRAKQGAPTRTVEEVEKATETARRLAEKGMKRLVFDISHRTDAAAALRFISPFFAATAESFQRWGRILADRPEVAGYAAKIYNAPSYVGHMQTSDGNQIFPDGTYIDPATGERKLARKGERWITGRVPDWVVNSPIGVAFGIERSSGKFMLSQNSMHMVTMGDPWYNPGVGPIVQIPVQEFVADKPAEAEVARHLGILPFGPSTRDTAVGRTAETLTPAMLRHFMTGFDTSDHRYQQVKLQVMQRAIYEHEQEGKPMLSAQEIADRTRDYWVFSAASAFLQPMATQRKDAYQFYRDQYNNLRRQHGENSAADLEFLDRFGEDFFVFTASTSRHKAGVAATRQAHELAQEYKDILQDFPELGPLLIGAEGNGPFSPEVYAYQLNSPLTPGDDESQRMRLSASEVMEENQRRMGWAQYSAYMNWLNAELARRGLTNLEQEGAEDLANDRRAWISALAEPMLPTGEPNPAYNERWSEDWYSFDARKYERLIPKLQEVAQRGLERDPDRGDLASLLGYLELRQTVQGLLAHRPFKSLGAQANTDLRRAWTAAVGHLVESNTQFGDLHSRYLSRDMGVDMDEEAEVMSLLEQEVP
jgi:hypothetical protein